MNWLSLEKFTMPRGLLELTNLGSLQKIQFILLYLPLDEKYLNGMQLENNYFEILNWKIDNAPILGILNIAKSRYDYGASFGINF